MRVVKISDSLAAILVACRSREGLEKPPALALTRITSAERSLDRELPDDLVAAWACVGCEPNPDGAAENFSPEGAVAATAMAEDVDYITDGLPDDFVALFNTGTRGEFVCLENTKDKKGEKHRRRSQIVTMQLSDEEPPTKSGRSLPLDEWLSRRYGITAKDLTAAKRRAKDLTIVLEPPPTRRIRHPKFGPGEVVEEVGDRVTVHFADGQTRKLLLT